VSAAELQPEQLSARARHDAGPAVVAVLRLRRGIYACTHAEVRDGLLTFVGRRRESSVAGIRFYPIRRETLRLRPGESIEWANVEPLPVAA
jgi:hypothetical protein